MDGSGVEHGNYRITIVYSDSNIDFIDLPAYQIFIIVTYENGESKVIYQF